MFIARCVPVLKGDVSVTRLIMLHWTGGYLGPGGVRGILPYPSTLVGCPSPLLSPILLSDTFKRNLNSSYDGPRPSYCLKFSANPLREHVKFLTSRHTRWVAGSCALSAYRFRHFYSRMYLNLLIGKVIRVHKTSDIG